MAIDKKSRYYKTPTAEATDPQGEAFEFFELREIPPTSGVFRATPKVGDRLDLLAHRHYRDATRFWRICDASDHLDPFDVLEPGEPLLIPTDK